MKTQYISSIAVALGVLSIAGGATRDLLAQGGPPAVFQAAGPTTASILGTIDAYRAALGGINNANNPGPLPTGRREINWDGGGSATTPAVTPFVGFLNIRGAAFLTPGSGFVQAPPSGLATTFGNATYETTFAPFSLQRLFSPVESNVTDTFFFIPGTNGQSHATTAAFGAIFSDVDRPDGTSVGGAPPSPSASTFIEYFDFVGNLLYSSFVPATPGTAGFSFFGIVFNDARIGRVRITAGNAAPGPNDDATRDIVMLDDFIYSEPQPR